MQVNQIIKLYEDKFHVKPEEIKKLTGGGSEREYYLLTTEGKSILGVKSPDTRENETFIRLSKVFKNSGNINVPEIIAVDEDKKCYLEEYLGDISLFNCLKTDQRNYLSLKSLEELIKIQTVPENLWINIVFENPFSERLILSDLHYFKFCLLKTSGLTFDNVRIEDEFHYLKEKLLLPSSSPEGFMFRDFQSRNILISDNKPYLIDYQGGMKGPVIYDLVSFLWQAKAGFSDEEKSVLTDHYLSNLQNFINFDIDKVKNSIKYFALFRILQTLGAYGFRGLFEGKKHFIESLPVGIENLIKILKSFTDNKFVELRKIAEDLKEKFNYIPVFSDNTKIIDNSIINKIKKVPDNSSLVLTVRSFSFKKDGYPECNLDHGGGFVFDCRGLPNPGRYPEYADLTGKDESVREYLQKFKEPEEFVDYAIKIVSISVNTYLERNFSSLEVNFGCTGGHHRSVWCAERFTTKMKHIFPGLKINLSHLQHP